MINVAVVKRRFRGSHVLKVDGGKFVVHTMSWDIVKPIQNANRQFPHSRQLFDDKTTKYIVVNLILGLCIGAFVSLVGGGGASLYLAVLTTQLPAPIAVSTSLFVALPALLVGTISQIHIHNVRWNIGNRFIIAAIPSIVVGTILGKFIPDHAYMVIIGILLFGLGCFTLVRNMRQNKSQGNTFSKSQPRIAHIFGIFAGLMVGIGGLSGGAITVAGLSLLGLPPFAATGTATYIMFVMSVVGFAGHAITTPIAWESGFFLMVGAMISSAIMPLLLSRIDVRKLNKPLGIIMGLFVMFFGAKMIITA